MSITVYEGGAGSGKTTSVMQQLRTLLQTKPLLVHQRVLALTYMHGARHRLDETLSGFPEIRNKYDASTLDSFAWHICRRWRSRLRERGIGHFDAEDFDANIRFAGDLLQDKDVRTWVSSVYPIVLIDEAQDLEQMRLRIIDSLIQSSDVLLAFDEFQCLNSENRPAAVQAWITGKCIPFSLNGNKRTRVSDLLNAASQIRSASPVTLDGTAFRVIDAPARKDTGPRLAATLAAYEIVKGGSFALLTPSQTSSYALDIMSILQTEALGKQKNVGPFKVRWEATQDDDIGHLLGLLDTSSEYTVASLRALLVDALTVPTVAMLFRSLLRMQSANGNTVFARQTVVDTLKRHITTMKNFTRRTHRGLHGLTIHQAKNREFDRVVVIWPFKIPPDDDSRRRLLYNAVTRARKSCLVLVQNKTLLSSAPFV